jgi:hypothetical protein
VQGVCVNGDMVAFRDVADKVRLLVLCYRPKETTCYGPTIFPDSADLWTPLKIGGRSRKVSLLPIDYYDSMPPGKYHTLTCKRSNMASYPSSKSPVALVQMGSAYQPQLEGYQALSGSVSDSTREKLERRPPCPNPQ